MYEEKNTGTNLPAQIDIYATDGDEYKFLFVAKGGGSANKTFLFQETKALLNPERLGDVLRREDEDARHRRLPALPPRLRHRRHLRRGLPQDGQAGLDQATSTTCRRPATSTAAPSATSSSRHELLEAAQQLGIGAQFGGKYFALDVRVIRLPRHGASCPVGIGVSCSADRNVKAKINRDGILLEKLEQNPGRFIPEQHARRRRRRPSPSTSTGR